MSPLPPVDGLLPFAAAHGAALRQRLAHLGLDGALAERHAQAAARAPEIARPLALRLHAEALPPPLATAVRVLLDGATVDAAAARGAFGPLVEPMLAAGLLRPEGGDTCACPFLLAFAGPLPVVADPLDAGDACVMGINPFTAALARVGAGLSGAARVLDLGCGAGALAVLSAAQGSRAVATDVNPRALALARVNAALNGVEVDVRAGSAWEPLEGERFDLVLSQPPFVARAPDEEASTFLHGGARGDELPLAFLAGLAEHLSEDGAGAIVVEWPVGAALGSPASVPARARAAAGAADRDLLLVATPAHDAGDVALWLAARSARGDAAAFERAATARLRHYRALGVEGFVQTIVVVGPRTGRAGAVRVLPTQGLEAAPLSGARLAALFRALGVLGRPPSELAGVAFRVPEGTVFREEQAGPGQDQPSTLTAVPPPEALVAPCPLEPEDLFVVTAVHEAPSLGEGVESAAAQAELDPADLLRRAVGAIGRGLLEPVEPAPDEEREERP